jgi:hypothetical protein
MKSCAGAEITAPHGYQKKRIMKFYKVHFIEHITLLLANYTEDNKNLFRFLSWVKN